MRPIKKAEITHADNAAAFIKWLFGHPEAAVRNRILEEIYPDIKDRVSDILFYHLLNDSLPSFVPAIIKYVSEAKGITVSVDDQRVCLAAETVEVITCMAVGEEPDIAAGKLLYFIRRAVLEYTETYLNMPEEDFERIYDGISSELREYMHPQ